jgi:drug/metabolite transporter (DMT)-like permease
VRVPSSARPTLAYIASGLVFSSADTLVKSLVSTIAPADVVWGRSLVYVTLLVVFAGRPDPRRLLRTHALPRQLLRGASLFGATLCFFYALGELPLGQVTALASATPLIVVAIAGPLLGERVSPLAILGAIIGFGGVLILVGGDLSGFTLATLLPLGTATFFAAFSVLSRSLNGEDQYVTLFFTGASMLALSTGFRAIAPAAEPPTTLLWLAIGLIGVCSLVGHRLVVLAYRDGRASDLAPLGYLSLVWSFTYGYLIFGEPIEPAMLAGAVAIAAGGILAYRASWTGSTAAPTASPVDDVEPVEVAAEAGAQPAAFEPAEPNATLDDPERVLT